MNTLEKLNIRPTIRTEAKLSDDRLLLNSLTPPELVAVLEPSETTYTNLINAEMVELCAKFKSVKYDPSNMIAQIGSHQLLIGVMEHYVFMNRYYQQREFFTYVYVVINMPEGRPIPADDYYEREYVQLKDFMGRVYEWLNKYVR